MQLVPKTVTDFGEFFLYWKQQLVWGVDTVGEMIGAIRCNVLDIYFLRSAQLHSCTSRYGGPFLSLSCAFSMPCGIDEPISLNQVVAKWESLPPDYFQKRPDYTGCLLGLCCSCSVHHSRWFLERERSIGDGMVDCFGANDCYLCPPTFCYLCPRPLTGFRFEVLETPL
jgi:hypothetical protein